MRPWRATSAPGRRVVRIYEFQVQDGYEWALPVADDDFEILRSFDGSARERGWRAIQMELVREDEGHRFLPSDMPWLGGDAPILKQKAVDALGPVLTKNGELLPLACDEAKLWVFNATTIRDALDLDHSDLVKFSSARIMDVTSYVFRPDRLGEVYAFRVPQLDSVFVTGEVVERSAALTGVGFKLLWEGPAKPA